MTPPTQSADGPIVDRASDTSVSTRRPVGRQPLVNFVIAPLVVVLALVVLVLAGTGAYNATLSGVEVAQDPSQAASLELTRSQIEVLRSQFVAQVPAGSRVFIDPKKVDVEFQQRLAEFAAIKGVYVVADIRQADYNIFVVGAPEALPAGVRLVVEKVR